MCSEVIRFVQIYNDLSEIVKLMFVIFKEYFFLSDFVDKTLCVCGRLCVPQCIFAAPAQRIFINIFPAPWALRITFNGYQWQERSHL